jgi:hypothetical protein
MSGRRVAFFLLVAMAFPAVSRAEIQKLTLFEKTARAPIVIMAVVTDGENQKAELRTREMVTCSIVECPGEVFRLAFRLDSFLRKPWEDKIEFRTGEEVVLFLRKFTKQDGNEAPPDLYTLMWGSEGKFLLPPEGAQAYIEAIRTFRKIAAQEDPLVQEQGFIEGIRGKNPFVIEASFQEMIEQFMGELTLVPDLTAYFDHQRADFRALAMRLLARILDDARTRGAEIPLEAELADRLRGRAALDAAEEFRVEAVRALAALGGGESKALLERLAKEDPSQLVRYEAARRLLSWKE